VLPKEALEQSKELVHILISLLDDLKLLGQDFDEWDPEADLALAYLFEGGTESAPDWALLAIQKPL
jgi:hypothetical protein